MSIESRVRAWSSTPRWRAEASTLLDALALPRGAHVLDVGMGAGALWPLLHARGLEAFGVDRWDGWEAQGDSERAVRGDACRLPFSAGTFDGVVFSHVLAHVTDPATALCEARRVLRPAGRVGIATPNALFVRAMALPSRVNGYRADPTVVAHFSSGALRALVQDAGLHLVEARAFGKLPWTLPLAPCRERLLFVAEAPP